MSHRLTRGVNLKVRLGDVGAQAAAIMNQDVIPWLVSRRLGLVGKIPRISSHALRIAGNDDRSVMVKAMTDDLPQIENYGVVTVAF